MPQLAIPFAKTIENRLAIEMRKPSRPRLASSSSGFEGLKLISKLNLAACGPASVTSRSTDLQPA